MASSLTSSHDISRLPTRHLKSSLMVSDQFFRTQHLITSFSYSHKIEGDFRFSIPMHGLVPKIRPSIESANNFRTTPSKQVGRWKPDSSLRCAVTHQDTRGIVSWSLSSACALAD